MSLAAYPLNDRANGWPSPQSWQEQIKWAPKKVGIAWHRLLHLAFRIFAFSYHFRVLGCKPSKGKNDHEDTASAIALRLRRVNSSSAFRRLGGGAKTENCRHTPPDNKFKLYYIKKESESYFSVSEYHSLFQCTLNHSACHTIQTPNLWLNLLCTFPQIINTHLHFAAPESRQNVNTVRKSPRVEVAKKWHLWMLMGKWHYLTWVECSPCESIRKMIDWKMFEVKINTHF